MSRLWCALLPCRVDGAVILFRFHAVTSRHLLPQRRLFFSRVPLSLRDYAAMPFASKMATLLLRG